MTTAEKVTAAMMKAFVEYQEKSEDKFMKFEPRAKEDRAHEECMLRRLLVSQQVSHVSQYPPMYYSGHVMLRMVPPNNGPPGLRTAATDSPPRPSL